MHFNHQSFLETFLPSNVVEPAQWTVGISMASAGLWYQGLVDSAGSIAHLAPLFGVPLTALLLADKALSMLIGFFEWVKGHRRKPNFGHPPEDGNPPSV
jgi:hypothetical protein